MSITLTGTPSDLGDDLRIPAFLARTEGEQPSPLATERALAPVKALPPTRASEGASHERATMTDIPPDGRPEQPVESVDRNGLSLMQVLATCDAGQVATELNGHWNDLIRQLMSLEVNEGIRKSKGSLTIKIGVEYEDGTVKLKIEEAVKVPKAPQRAAVFWVTGDGRVTPENPRQMTMFKDVPRRHVTVV